MDPRIWGPHTWFFLHTLTFSYPDNPSKTDKINMENFIFSLSNVLPCSVCKKHFQQNLKKYPVKNFLNSRDEYVNWMIDIHNVVNRNTGKKIRDNVDIIKNYNDLYKKKFTCSLSDRKKKNHIINIIVFIIIIYIFMLIGYVIIFKFFIKSKKKY